MSASEDVLIITLGGDVYVKSRHTRRRFRRTVVDNLREAVSTRDAEVDVERLDAGRLLAKVAKPDVVAEAAASTFGVHRVERSEPFRFGDLGELVRRTARRARGQVAGHTFAVRVRRQGGHDWRSMDAERLIGDELLASSTGVDLDQPEVTVSVVVVDQDAWLVRDTWEGPGGLPLGTQGGCLSLLSGGYDSPVAAWMVMRRGSPVHFLHLQLDCAQADHAIVVARQLWRRWGSGTHPLVWIVDFEAVQTALREYVAPRLRQVVLKQLMFRAADGVAAAADVDALVTGEALGQVSSQTLAHLSEIDRMARKTVLRPLAGFDKQEIIARARSIGTAELSARAKEVCDLSAGSRVAVAAGRQTLDSARRQLSRDLVDDAVAARRVVALEDWVPGQEPTPVGDFERDRSRISVAQH